MKLVECVPNFSEGRDRNIIDAITGEIDGTEGATLLDVDPGRDTNRTVVTFLGSPDGAVEAAFRAIAKAAELIDMRAHKGAHARMGATDVCPFVPVAGVTIEECVELARKLGERVAEELGIPVYLYEEAASRPERKSLAEIRRGEYEGLPEKLKDPDWVPDFGEPRFNPKSGATVIGVREFLIAYNVNFNTMDRKLVHDIALTLREAGRAKRDEQGRIVRDERGRAIKAPGRLKATRMVGWVIPEYGMAQLSINLTNYKITPPHIAFDEACVEAERRGIRVTGSELVGLIPKEAMLTAGRHYLEKQGKSPGVPEEELIRVAVLSMGMDQLGAFDPHKKIVEYRVAAPGGSQKESLRGFCGRVSMDTPTPGGGSVSALCGALGGSLAAMVANLTVGKVGFEQMWGRLGELATEAQLIKDRLLNDIDRDSHAFDRVMEAMRLPKKTEQQKRERLARTQEAYLGAAAVPLDVMDRDVAVLELALQVATHGNPASVSDAGCAALAAAASLRGAHLNVRVNLPNCPDGEQKTAIESRAEGLLSTGLELASKVEAVVEEKMPEV